ncbi:MAG: Delta-aminolevulinic acid dehydratase [Thermodesulfobacterium sp. 37_54]|jgi:porphobilinogen synthase|uniref:porphobilinogen synthase n=1 Tax=Thermodesulfobacterium TaxID=1740 RepID=UPI000746D79C|nr:porphobilinogen synthase [Thermodesulfobacterium sp.]KUJ97362.1 MAG: Delta-aminolevulinic acid dehydratase [Thermodesulfobacterium sp. 37_54]KUK18998.1 MAG: Delta-aminolevulinic acid dehydratase [Thermodesulfobacterium commune]KUK37537.1 MAG: Delta-aminolevulinic acid dehydratase [Thermodesulfobacterium commune]MDK2861211.1 porphobilinogen synthase [Thermodesulfobacterium sp.]MDN5379703.1 porphobilinogen synthase [Thermodesulfobacterium sp.]
MFFPEYRPRRLRKNENIRSLVRETIITVDDLIYPLFVCEGKGVKQEIRSMPEVYRFSLDQLIEEVKQVVELGIKAVLLFGIPDKKDEVGSSAYAKDGIVQKAVRTLKEKFPDLVVITDVCLCEYTSHGHCGIIKNHTVDNDATLEQLAKIAVSHAKAGADIVAPSDMMDGRVGRIREALDEAGFTDVAIMSYAVKYCSAFYGPFREAAESAPQFGDRRSYQMDPANIREALREAYLDVQEGADILMVKPAMPYLDVIKTIRQEFNHPLAAYQVSGEYAMIKAASKLGWLDEEKIMFESLIAIKRAGADLIITYFAKKVAQTLAKR